MVLVFSGTAFAASSWSPVKGTEGTTVLADLSNIKKNGDIIEVLEQYNNAQADAKGIKRTDYIRQYNLDDKKVRTISTSLYNAKGMRVATKKAGTKWEKVKAKTFQEENMNYYSDCARKLGSWEKAKDIGDVAVKYFDAATIKRKGSNVIDVWEKLKLNKVTNNIKSVVSHVQYDKKAHRATTVYTCNYDAKGNLVSANSNIDKWSSMEDTYGEYIADLLDKHLSNKKKK